MHPSPSPWVSSFSSYLNHMCGTRANCKSSYMPLTPFYKVTPLNHVACNLFPLTLYEAKTSLLSEVVGGVRSYVFLHITRPALTPRFTFLCVRRRRLTPPVPVSMAATAPLRHSSPHPQEEEIVRSCSGSRRKRLMWGKSSAGQYVGQV